MCWPDIRLREVPLSHCFYLRLFLYLLQHFWCQSIRSWWESECLIQGQGLYLCMAALGLPTSLFVFKSYFQGIPKELEEAAYIDGAGFYRTFFVIVFPLAKSGLATGAILQFLTSWNEFMFGLVLTKSTEVRTFLLLWIILHLSFRLTIQRCLRHWLW